MHDTTREPPASPRPTPTDASRLALSLLWSRAEPERVGEVAMLRDGEWLIGRGEGPERRVRFARYGLGPLGEGRPLGSESLSRRQATLEARGDALEIENLGRRALRHRGAQVARCVARVGDLVELEGEALFLVERRSAELLDDGAEAPRLGDADIFGIVGESEAIWRLRRDLRFVARRAGHVLVLGPSGSGKESAARAIHLLSDRRGRAFVARNAAAFPDSLIEAELFGHARDYPNAGMPERVGVFTESDRGSLFLDEIAEMPVALQARLLRVLDAGEFSRLGERGARRVDVRVIGATNRPPEALKHDVRARFAHTLRVPPLDERAADIPLLVRHLIREAARTDRELAARFVDERGAPRVTCGFVAAQVQRSWPANVRELASSLWQAMRDAPGDTLHAEPRPEPRPEPPEVEAAEIARDAVVASLERNAGVRERVWRDLGLQSRHQLLRLMRKHGLE